MGVPSFVRWVWGPSSLTVWPIWCLLRNLITNGPAANATSMAVRERVREVGLLRALGFSRRRIVALIATESLALALLGGILGCAASFTAVALSDVKVSVGSYSFPVAMSMVLALAGAAASALVGVLGGFPAGIRASRRPIVESLRSIG